MSELGIETGAECFHVTRACLQVSVGAFIAAQAVLEEFLAIWGVANLEDCGEKVDPGHQISTVDKHSSNILRISEKYGDVVEFYILHVLLKGLKKTESALYWAEHANLTQERRIVSLLVN